MFSFQCQYDPKFRFKYHQGLGKLSEYENAIDHRLLMVNDNKIVA